MWDCSYNSATDRKQKSGVIIPLLGRNYLARHHHIKFLWGDARGGGENFFLTKP